MASRKARRSSTKRRATRSPPGGQCARSTAAADSPVVIYIHGIMQRESAAALKLQWDDALFGGAMAGRTRMAYWADGRQRGGRCSPGRGCREMSTVVGRAGAHVSRDNLRCRVRRGV